MTIFFHGLSSVEEWCVLIPWARVGYKSAATSCVFSRYRFSAAESTYPKLPRLIPSVGRLVRHVFESLEEECDMLCAAVRLRW